MASQTRLHRIAADQKLIDGVQKHMSQIDSLSVGSQKMAPADLVKLLQNRIDAANAVVDADAAKLAAVKAERDGRAKTSKSVSALRRIVVGMFFESPDTLATFGLKAPKVGKKDVETMSTAVAKNLATRKARHTLGRKQREEIHGSVDEQSSGASNHQPPAKQPSA